MDKFMHYIYYFNTFMLLVYMVAYFRLHKKYTSLANFTMRLSDDAIRVKKENDILKSKMYG